MKKTIKILFVLFILGIIIVSTTYATSLKIENVDINKKDSNKQYRTNSINILGINFKYQDEVIIDGENSLITEEQKQTNNMIVIIFSALLVIFWIILLYLYEREDYPDYIHENNDDIELLRKYNPMIAGCLVANRDVLPRDITAVILNLIQKNAINMKMVPATSGKEEYKYIISENNESTADLDVIERYILGWLFGFYEKEEVELTEKLKDLSKDKDFLKHMKKINKMAQEKLNSIGANIHKVPLTIRIINFVLLAFSVILTTIHIINNGINIHIYQTTIFLFLFIVAAVMIVLPLVAFIIHLLLLMIVYSKILIKKLIKNSSKKHDGKKIIETSTLILITIFIFIILTYFILPDKYLCLDIFMIGMCILLIKTDNLMTKHNKEVLNDYYCLQEVKNKIEEYSLIKDEQINYIKLWDEYLIYATAFGIPIPIVNKLKETYKENQDLEYLAKCENLYYISKAYLEVMWEMNFKEKKNKYRVKELFSFQEYDRHYDRDYNQDYNFRYRHRKRLF